MHNDLSDGGEGLFINETCGDKDQMELSDLGEILPCTECARPTYDGKALDKKGFGKTTRLPFGFTSANRRRFVKIGVGEIRVCTDCRYNVYGAY